MANDRGRTGPALSIISVLGAGRWSAARDAFERELAGRRTPEALEGLSWAAWWLDDEPAVFEAREQAYALYRRERRPADAARMATWLAVDQLDFRGAGALDSRERSHHSGTNAKRRGASVSYPGRFFAQPEHLFTRAASKARACTEGRFTVSEQQHGRSAGSARLA